MKKIAIILAFCISGAAFAADEKASNAPMPDSDSTARFDDDSVKGRLIYSPDRWAEIHGLVQAGYSYTKTWDTSLRSDGTTPKETDDKARWRGDAYLKAARLSMNGQLGKGLYFFYQTADLNTGKNAQNTNKKDSSKATTYTQDAYMKVEFAQAFQVYAGMLTVPRDRQNLQSQASLLTANGQFLMRSSMDGYSNNGRDTGLMIRGFFPGKKPILEYRLGVFEGLGRELDDDGNVTRNRHNQPRYAGRIQLTAGDTEESYFYSENYLGKRSYLAWGFGMDYQADQRNKKDNYVSYASDLSMEAPIPMGTPLAFTGQGGFVKAINLPDNVGLEKSSYLQIYAQMGVLIADKVQPTLKFSYLNTDKTRFFTFGLNYYFNGHYSNAKFDFDLPAGDNRNDSDQYKATLQFQGYL
jgi:hypothetical protein